MQFVEANITDFLHPLYDKAFELKDFDNFYYALKTYKETLQIKKDSLEDTLVSDVLKPFFDSLGFHTHTKVARKGNSVIDLALSNNSEEDLTIQVLIEAKVPNKKTLFKKMNLM